MNFKPLNKSYILYKAVIENLNAELLELEKAYVYLQKIKKRDGTSVTILSEIDDEKIANYHTKCFYSLKDVRCLVEGLCKAKQC